jgi:probable HAF family extracellular repeat protein
VFQGQVYDLGSLGSGGSFGLDINNNGQIVGYSELDNQPLTHGFLYQDGRMFDLNSLLAADPGWVIGRATAINDAGQIVGRAYFNGASRAFLLTPIPEPGTVALGFTVLVVWMSIWAGKRQTQSNKSAQQPEPVV